MLPIEDRDENNPLWYNTRPGAGVVCLLVLLIIGILLAAFGY